jgi:hypothetical protein
MSSLAFLEGFHRHVDFPIFEVQPRKLLASESGTELSGFAFAFNTLRTVHSVSCRSANLGRVLIVERTWIVPRLDSDISRICHGS